MSTTDPNPNTGPAPAEPAAPTGRAGDVIPFGQAVKAWFAISLQTFGGPAGQIAVMQRHLVDERRWTGQKRFLHALNYCMLLPGPEAQQLAIYIGWLLNGIRGGLVAGTLFLPGLLALLGLSALYAGYGDTTVVTALFAGLAPAVVAIVAQAVWRVGTRALANNLLVGFAVAAFVALAVFGVPFPIVIAVAALAGWAQHRWRPSLVTAKDGHGAAKEGPAPLIPDDALHHDRRSGRRAAIILAIGLAAWFVPVALVATATGARSVFTQQGLFFSGAAVVTFGGAYAVLAYVAQRAVEHYAWLSAGDMVRGLALAETTPRAADHGPAVRRVPRRLPPPRQPQPLGRRDHRLTADHLGHLRAVLPVHPARRPYVERLRGNHALSAALTGITAAVVGRDRQPRPLLRRPHPLRPQPRDHHRPAQPPTSGSQLDPADSRRDRGHRRRTDLQTEMAGHARSRHQRRPRPRRRPRPSRAPLRLVLSARGTPCVQPGPRSPAGADQPVRRLIIRPVR